MGKRDEIYQSYLLRLRRHQRDGRLRWQVSLEEPRSGRLRTFRNLDRAVEFLRRQMKVEEVKGDVGEDDALGNTSA